MTIGSRLPALALLVGLEATGLAAGAGVGDGTGPAGAPLPASPEGDLLPAFRASGVRDASAAATVVHCTNLGPAAQSVFVEFTDFDGTFACEISASVAPNETRTLGSRATAFYLEDAICSPAPTIAQGSLRVGLFSATELICTVQILDPAGATPAFLDRLELYHGSGVPLSLYIFSDGFESGDTSAWDQTVP